MPLLGNHHEIIIGIGLEGNSAEAKKIGFSENLEEGECLLLSVIGPATHFNAEGRFIVRKDLPLEIQYRQSEWHWKEWRGKGQTIDRWKIVDIPYKRYPRDFIEPSSIELTISRGKIISPLFRFAQDDGLVLNAINVFLEVFGECTVLTNDLQELANTPGKALKWSILPQGVMPWQKVEKELGEAFKKAGLQEKVVFKERFRELAAYGPDFHAVGLAGFAGYVIFGFKERTLYICESMWHGNAIYVFEENWRELSKKTKAEILQGNLQKKRIVHYGEWKAQIRGLIKDGSKDGKQ